MATKRRTVPALERPAHIGRKGVNQPGQADLREWGIGGGQPATEEAAPDFSGVAVTGNTDALNMLPTMVETLRNLQRAADQAAQRAEEAAAKLSHFQMIVLPEAMELAGVAEYKLTDGSTLKVKPDLKASIPKEDLDKRERCFAWLQDNGHGSIIKTFFDVDVRALTPKQRASLAKMIEKKGLHADVKQDVHWQTLKSLVKELLENGTELPPDFSIHQFKKAELKEPKG
jgi:flavin-binding protein dodecin